MPGRVRNGSDGLLLSSGLYLGGYFGSICTGLHNRLQLRIRNMPSSLRCGIINTDTLRLVTTKQTLLHRQGEESKDAILSNKRKGSVKSVKFYIVTLISRLRYQCADS